MKTVRYAFKAMPGRRVVLASIRPTPQRGREPEGPALERVLAGLKELDEVAQEVGLRKAWGPYTRAAEAYKSGEISLAEAKRRIRGA